jgi:MFS family permease
VRPTIRLGLPPDGRRLFWAMVAWEFGFGLFNLLLTLHLKALGASPTQIGVLLGVQGIARILVTLPAGILAERFSRRKLIVWTNACTVPAALLMGLAQTWWHMLPGLILLMAGNIGTPAMASYVVDLSTPATRARTFAMIYSVGPAAATIISPTLGGVIADQSSIRVLFFLCAISWSISTVALHQISERRLTVHHEARPSYREVAANPAVRAVALLRFGVLGTLMMGVTFLPNYLEEIHHFSTASIGPLGSIYAAGSVILSLLIARVVWLTGSRGIALGAVSVGAVCGVTLLTGNLLILAPFFLLRGGFMVTWALFGAVFGDISPDRMRSRVFALGDFLGAIGIGLAPFAAGPLYAWRPAAPLLLCAALTPLLGLAALVIERKYVIPATADRVREREAIEPVLPTGGLALAEGVS